MHIHRDRDEAGASKGYAFIRFQRVEDAQAAHAKLGGLELARKAIKVSQSPSLSLSLSLSLNVCASI